MNNDIDPFVIFINSHIVEEIMIHSLNSDSYIKNNLCQYDSLINGIISLAIAHKDDRFYEFLFCVICDKDRSIFDNCVNSYMRSHIDINTDANANTIDANTINANANAIINANANANTLINMHNTSEDDMLIKKRNNIITIIKSCCCMQ